MTRALEQARDTWPLPSGSQAHGPARNDDPSPVAVWLPAFARFVGAPPPPRITEEQARASAGEDIVYYGTKLRGASNVKAKETFGFEPRRLEWLGR